SSSKLPTRRSALGRKRPSSPPCRRFWSNIKSFYRLRRTCKVEEVTHALQTICPAGFWSDHGLHAFLSERDRAHSHRRAVSQNVSTFLARVFPGGDHRSGA